MASWSVASSLSRFSGEHFALFRPGPDIRRAPELGPAWTGRAGGSSPGGHHVLCSASLAADSAAPSSRSPRKENVPGEFYVDHTCIDCDTCRWMAPEVFSREAGMSAVHRQPATGQERLAALQALLSCPTASIRTHEPPRDIRGAQASFPLVLSDDLPGVFHCGFHSEKSYGATAYFVQTPRGNILVDSPRYSEILAKQLEAMGGVAVLFLTHRDDVADHDKWSQRLGCPRVMHSGDVGPSTRAVEVQLQGDGAWDLFSLVAGPEAQDSSQSSSKESSSSPTVVFTPGHTAGCCCLLLPAGTTGPGQVGALFSGDHVALHRTGALTLFPGVNRAGLALQAQSARALAPLPFLWLLPGHGRRYRFRDEAERVQMLESF